jgi:hypothetical protein
MGEMKLSLLITGTILFVLLHAPRTSGGVPPGSIEGHLKIASHKEVELAGTDEKPPAGSGKTESPVYESFPLIVLSRDGKKEIARFMADEKGNYHAELPPGDYTLDVQGRRPGGIRAKPQPFTVAPGQTVHVDMDIDIGVR